MSSLYKLLLQAAFTTKVVDLATLTGACVVALGSSIAGIFTPSDDLAKEVVAASEVSGEKFWRMPLEESYWETMKSGVADMVNTGARQGGSITAALFLKQVYCNGRQRGCYAIGKKSTAIPSHYSRLGYSSAEADTKLKKKICCACPETKKLRDECVVQNGEDKCSKFIEAHKQCLRSEGFNV
ncbi:uncharacterized protein A4U43_C01F34210 [Asparagus officinalis]|uniref:Cytosol aminopeptidase domain-containing protein n=1 Tax=Asparagus officinalis TaxID=4686 RepID=A0A5P1FVT8_ASPOF|nr:uncharacterized protein A4U43_C01F34210 [Asparagus officinalis]